MSEPKKSTVLDRVREAEAKAVADAPPADDTTAGIDKSTGKRKPKGA